MAKERAAAKQMAPAGGDLLLSERLLAVLTREMDALEESSKEFKHSSGGDPVVGGGVSAGAKGRIEAVGQMTRTLEKLLELTRLEAMAARGDEDEDGEAARLRDELLKRLRALDARRRVGPTLFGVDGRYAGHVVAGDAGSPPLAGGPAENC